MRLKDICNLNSNPQIVEEFETNCKVFDNYGITYYHIEKKIIYEEHRRYNGNRSWSKLKVVGYLN